MATTMSLIAKQTVGAGGAASVTFSNIPQTFTDLKLVMSAKGSASGTRQNVLIQFNGSGSNFTWLGLYGYNTSVGSNTTSNNFAGNLPNAGNTANSFGTQEIYIPNYISNNAKSVSVDYAVENNGTDNFMGFDADLWNPGTQAPITSITLSINSSGNFIEYSTFYLYGISSSSTQNTSVPLASGGDVITTDGSYWYHTFLYSGTFTPLKNLTCDVMSVGAGGGGGNFGGGGGAGELDLFSTQSLITQNYAVTIGAGGAGSTSYSANGSSGGTSSFGSLITSLGGGGGGRDGEGGGTGGLAGGSGGGGGKVTNGGAASGSNTFAGGNGGGSAGGVMAAGGGGGATAAGSAGVNVAFASAVGGNGGEGYLLSSITNKPNVFGSMTRISSGGGGGAFCVSSVGNNPVGGTGGAGGGNGGTDKQGGTVAPTAATSFGSGGGGSGSGNGAAGYQGIIIVRYAV
jgi:hypothetical protein